MKRKFSEHLRGRGLYNNTPGAAQDALAHKRTSVFAMDRVFEEVQESVQQVYPIHPPLTPVVLRELPRPLPTATSNRMGAMRRGLGGGGGGTCPRNPSLNPPPPLAPEPPPHTAYCASGSLGYSDHTFSDSVNPPLTTCRCIQGLVYKAWLKVSCP